ncbi:GMC oxidoreductase [Streptomyces sp. NPDC049627]|uniref:GMC oxidoreductase n=1 Tax=Streptomyces sp. NPDC049627 TaxID=3365595 RepID=UPI0037AAFE88
MLSGWDRGEVFTVSRSGRKAWNCSPRSPRAAFHPTAAADADPHHAPADPEGRLRGVHGVLITGASLLPSCPGRNPQLSVMAVALAVAVTFLGRSLMKGAWRGARTAGQRCRPAVKGKSLFH